MLTEREKEVDEPEEMDLISDNSEIDPVVIKPEGAPASFRSIMALVKLKEKHKFNVQNFCLTYSCNQKHLQL